MIEIIVKFNNWLYKKKIQQQKTKQDRHNHLIVFRCYKGR